MVEDKRNLTPNSIEIEYALSTINEKVKYYIKHTVLLWKSCSPLINTNIQLPLYTSLQDTIREQGDVKRGFSLQSVISKISTSKKHIINSILVASNTVIGTDGTSNCK